MMEEIIAPWSPDIDWRDLDNIIPLEEVRLEIVDLDALDRRVTVMIQHPLMSNASEATYGCMFDVAVGDRVICPPAPLWPRPFVGMVTGLVGDYPGPVKYLIGRIS